MRRSRFPAALFALACACLLFGAHTVLADQAGDAIGNAIGEFARQKTTAEEMASLLKQNASGTKMIQGAIRYAAAKSAFDKLIEKLDYQLERPESPDSSSAFQGELQAAAEKSDDFTKYVQDTLLGGKQEGTKGFSIEPISGLLKGLTDAGVTIWREWRTASKEKQELIRQQIERQRWRSFADIR